MIECPFCGEQFEADNLVFEFRYGDIANYYYKKNELPLEIPMDYANKPVYCAMDYESKRSTRLASFDTVVNPQKHTVMDPMKQDDNWRRIRELLSKKNVFSVECDESDTSLPAQAVFMPLAGGLFKKAHGGGVSTGMYCPICEEQLKANILRADDEIRILLVGRPCSGKTVYVTQLITEMLQNSLFSGFAVESAGRSVDEHYDENRKRVYALNHARFVAATNPGAVQEPYVYLLKIGQKTVRLIIQDIAGEDAGNAMKYNNIVRKSDLILFFIDPWHIPEVRMAHERNHDERNEVVNKLTNNDYQDLNGIFNQMLNSVGIEKQEQNEQRQLAGIMLVKGDYLYPPMLAGNSQPECEMMKARVPFRDPKGMEFTLGMRSSFVRQCLNEWPSVRSVVNSIEGKFSAVDTRYFVVSSLGQSTHLHKKAAETDTNSTSAMDAQFGVNGGSGQGGSDGQNYDEQVLDTPAVADHVIDPLIWCLKRRGLFMFNRK